MSVLLGFANTGGMVRCALYFTNKTQLLSSRRFFLSKGGAFTNVGLKLGVTNFGFKTLTHGRCVVEIERGVK